MALENINVDQLSNSITRAKKDLDYTLISQTRNYINENSFWVTDSKTNFTVALDQLTDLCKEFEKKLNDYNEIAVQIHKYQSLLEENNSMTHDNVIAEGNMDRYNNILKNSIPQNSFDGSQSSSIYDSDNPNKLRLIGLIEENNNIISANNQKINQNNNEMRSIEANIKSKLGI